MGMIRADLLTLTVNFSLLSGKDSGKDVLPVYGLTDALDGGTMEKWAEGMQGP